MRESMTSQRFAIPTGDAPIDLGHAFLQEKARRRQGENEVGIKTPAREIFDILVSDPEQITSSKKLFKQACENLLWIQDKNRRIRPFKLNRSQDILLDAYFEMRDELGNVMMNILKGRQQGMSTAIGGFACIEMIAHPNTRAMIASEEKGGSAENIFDMYNLYFKYYQDLMWQELKEYEWIWEGNIEARFKYGDSCHLYNGSQLKVVGEKLVTSRTLQFIHVSEAAFFNHLKDCLAMMLQTMPKRSVIFLETTAKEYGNDYYDEWMGACAGTSSFRPLFLPWFVHEEYSEPFYDEVAKRKFESDMGHSEDHEFGNEAELLTLDATKSDWFPHWKTLDFSNYKSPTLENLKWRRGMIRNLNGVIAEFNRQYPTLPEMAFLANTDHVLDMNAVRWYEQTMLRAPERGFFEERIDGMTMARYKEKSGGIISTWEHPNPHMEYILGVDAAEGMDSGDFSCAYVVSRLPFRIVARLRGYDGRRVNLREFTRQSFWLAKYYNNAWICHENNAQADTFTSLMLEWGYPNMIPEAMITKQGGASHRYGWRNTHGIRDRAISELQEVITDRMIGIPDELLLNEAHHFMFVNGKPQAARKGQSSGSGISLPGSHDDALFALMGALLANMQGVLPRPKTEEEKKFDEILALSRKEVKRRQKSSGQSNPWKHV